MVTSGRARRGAAGRGAPAGGLCRGVRARAWRTARSVGRFCSLRSLDRSVAVFLFFFLFPFPFNFSPRVFSSVFVRWNKKKIAVGRPSAWCAGLARGARWLDGWGRESSAGLPRGPAAVRRGRRGPRGPYGGTRVRPCRVPPTTLCFSAEEEYTYACRDHFPR